VWVSGGSEGGRAVTSARPDVPDLGCGVCIACGYDLRGSHPQQCPECGFDLPPDAIDLFVTSYERVLFGRLFLVFVFSMFILIAAPALYFGGTSPYLIAIGLLLVMAAAVLVLRVFSRVFHAPDAAGPRDAIRFTDAGVHCRDLGSWTILMPYDELDAFVLRPSPFRSAWRFRVTFRMFGISTSFAKGFMQLDDQSASWLRDEINGRIARANAKRRTPS